MSTEILVDGQQTTSNSKKHPKHSYNAGQKGKNGKHHSAVKQVVSLNHKNPKGETTRKLSNRARMRRNIKKAQSEPRPVLRRKAFLTILRWARAYMLTYKDNPKISQLAAEILVQDIEAHVNQLFRGANDRANIGKQGMAILHGKHMLSVMNDDVSRCRSEPCYIPLLASHFDE